MMAPQEVGPSLRLPDKVQDGVVSDAGGRPWGLRVGAGGSTADPASPPTLEELRLHCQQALAGYKAPRDVIVVDAVRRSPTGKADYRWAIDLAAGVGDAAVSTPPEG